MRTARAWLDAPQPILRLELVRVLAPLAILGFVSSRLAHVSEWVGGWGFRVPDLSGDALQPIYLPTLGTTGAHVFGVVLVISALSLSLGFRARWAALVFALLMTYAALEDRLATFTVTKLSPMVGFGLAASPCGSAFGIDAWLRSKKGIPMPRTVAGGGVRFFQAFLCTMYCASGLCKARGDWLKHPLVLWTHLHDTLQTWVSVLLANHIPGLVWTVAQGAVLAFEALAPLWFAWKKSRTWAMLFGVGMHAMIAVTFWPVRWFAMLMASLLIASFLPDELLLALDRRLRRWMKPRGTSAPTPSPAT
jgi:hypothetical protein